MTQKFHNIPKEKEFLANELMFNNLLSYFMKDYGINSSYGAAPISNWREIENKPYDNIIVDYQNKCYEYMLTNKYIFDKYLINLVIKHIEKNTKDSLFSNGLCIISSKDLYDIYNFTIPKII